MQDLEYFILYLIEAHREITEISLLAFSVILYIRILLVSRDP